MRTDKTKSMIEKIDINNVLKDSPSVTDGTHIYGELADGSRMKINKNALANVIRSQIGLSEENIRKTATLYLNNIVDFGIKGGLVVISTTSLQEQCVVLFSCYGSGDSAARIISVGNNAFVNGDRNTTNANKLVLFREDGANRCYLKSTYNTGMAISYQVVAGFW